jgi:hypothetical protein
MIGTEHAIDPYQIEPLRYLADLVGNLSGNDCVEHYQTLRPALLRLRQENSPAFDVALREVAKGLKIKQKAVLKDLAVMTPPPAAKGAHELLEVMGQTRQVRLAQDFMDGVLWYGVVAGDQKLLVNSNRQLLTLDQLPAGLKVKDRGFDLRRLSKDAILRFLHGDICPDPMLLADLRAFFSRFAVFRDLRLPLLLATWSLGI